MIKTPEDLNAQPQATADNDAASQSEVKETQAKPTIDSKAPKSLSNANEKMSVSVETVGSTKGD